MSEYIINTSVFLFLYSLVLAIYYFIVKTRDYLRGTNSSSGPFKGE